MPDGRLEALTPTGAFHIHRLRLNRAQLVALRQTRRRTMDDTLHISELESAIAQARREVADQERLMESLLQHILRLTEQKE